MKRILTLTALMAFVICITLGCAGSRIQIAHQTLDSAWILHNGVIQLAAELCGKKAIPHSKHQEILFLAENYRKVHLIAEKTLIAYERTKSAEDKDKLTVAVAEFLEVALELSKFISASSGVVKGDEL